MALFQCKACGGSLSVKEGSPVATCEYCGTKQTIPGDSSEKKVNLFNRANKLRSDREFDKAASVYESIAAEFPIEAEAYWGLCLCKFGIEYVDDPATGRKIPTCHRTSFESIFDDDNFEKAKENADSEAMSLYQSEAKEIDRIQQAILDIVKNEKPYDIFICYKETDEDTRQRTLDSVKAQDMYDQLTEKGYKVFFSRITLEGKLGTDYEPYIFAALNSAKVMLAVGGSFDNFNAVWVKNEWSRFLSLAKTDKQKVLIPCYFNIDPYDMPTEFKRLQGQDMNKVGFMQDLLHGIEKIIPRKGKSSVTEAVFGATAATAVSNLLTRAFDDELPYDNFEEADKEFDRVLELDPKNGRAYMGKLMAELNLNYEEDLGTCAIDYGDYANYKRAESYSDEPGKAKLRKYLASARKYVSLMDADESYNAALAAMDRGDYTGAEALLEKAQMNHDVSELQQKCTQGKQRAEEFTDRYNKLLGSYDLKRGTAPFAEKARIHGDFMEHIKRKYPGYNMETIYPSAHRKILLWLLPIGITLLIAGFICSILKGDNSDEDVNMFLISFGFTAGGMFISWIINGVTRVMGKLYYGIGLFVSIAWATVYTYVMGGEDEVDSLAIKSKAYIPFLAGAALILIALLIIIVYIRKTGKVKHFFRDSKKLERLYDEKEDALAADTDRLKAEYGDLPEVLINNRLTMVRESFLDPEGAQGSGKAEAKKEYVETH